MKTVKIGIVGIGAISGIYLKNITETFKEIDIVGVCDLIRERAEAAVEQYNIPKLYEDMYELFRDPEVDIVLNLTRPYEHYQVSMEALKAGKTCIFRKTSGSIPGRRERAAGFQQREGIDVGRSTGYFPGSRYPDLPQTDRRRLHRKTFGSSRFYDQSRT